MEDTRDSLELVRVLRHSFRPSEKFETFIDNFIPPSPEGARSLFAIRSLSMIALSLEGEEYNPVYYEQQIAAARSILQPYRKEVYEITGSLDVRRISQTAIALLVGVKQEDALRKLHSDTARKMPSGLRLRDPSGPNAQLYVRINSSQPITSEMIQRGEASFPTTQKDEEGRGDHEPHLFEVYPDALQAFDQRRVIKRPAIPLEEAS